MDWQLLVTRKNAVIDVKTYTVSTSLRYIHSEGFSPWRQIIIIIDLAQKCQLKRPIPYDVPGGRLFKKSVVFQNLTPQKVFSDTNYIPLLNSYLKNVPPPDKAIILSFAYYRSHIFALSLHRCSSPEVLHDLLLQRMPF